MYSNSQWGCLPVYYRINGLKPKKIGAFWKWQDKRILKISLMSNLFDFWRFKSGRCKNRHDKKRKLLLSNFKQFTLHYSGGVYAERSKIAKNRPKSTWIVFQNSMTLLFPKSPNFLILGSLFRVIIDWKL